MHRGDQGLPHIRRCTPGIDHNLRAVDWHASQSPTRRAFTGYDVSWPHDTARGATLHPGHMSRCQQHAGVLGDAMRSHLARHIR